jgi:hypothetical protein
LVLEIVSRQGMRTVLWSIDTVDWMSPGVPKMKSKVLDNLHEGAIVLMHPTEDTVTFLKETIPEIKNRGFNIVNMEQLLNPQYLPAGERMKKITVLSIKGTTFSLIVILFMTGCMAFSVNDNYKRMKYGVAPGVYLGEMPLLKCLSMKWKPICLHWIRSTPYSPETLIRILLPGRFYRKYMEKKLMFMQH